MLRFVFFAGLLAPFCLGQTRLIPHVTRPDGGFQTTVILLNTATTTEIYTLTPYDDRGIMLIPVSGTLQGGKKLAVNADQLFQGRAVSHFKIESSEKIRASVAYLKSGDPDASPAHVSESTVTARSWNLYTGNWETTWDGIAVVNMGPQGATVLVEAKDKDGRVLDFGTLTLGSMAKGLSVLSTHFEPNDQGYFEVSCTEPLALTALRGDGNSLLLWPNQAVATADAAYDRASLLLGTWVFDYSMDGAAFSQMYRFFSVVETNGSGEYTVLGVDDRGASGITGVYDSQSGLYTVRDPGSPFDRVFLFATDGEILLPGGCFFQVSPPGSDNYGDCFALSGEKLFNKH